jgi:hypothetical protein
MPPVGAGVAAVKTGVSAIAFKMNGISDVFTLAGG